MSEFKDLYENESEEGFWFNSWMCDGMVHFTWGLISIAIPKEEWQHFVDSVVKTSMAKKSVDEMNSAVAKNKKHKRNNNEDSKLN